MLKHYAGVFNYPTEAIKLFTFAHSEKQARFEMAERIAKKHNVDITSVFKWLKENEGSYYIKEDIFKHNEFVVQVSGWDTSIEEVDKLRKSFTISESKIISKKSGYMNYHALFRKLTDEEKEKIKSGEYILKKNTIYKNPRLICKSPHRKIRTTCFCMNCGRTFKTYDKDKHGLCGSCKRTANNDYTPQTDK